MKKITANDLTNDIITGIYDGLSRNDDLHPIYFDTKNFDIGSVVDGYFSSNLKDQETANRELMNRILNKLPKDAIHESRYIEINQIPFSNFIKEFLLMSDNKEPYISYAKEFCEKLEKIYDKSIDYINSTYDLQQEFGSGLMLKFQAKPDALAEFPNIWNFTTTNLAVSWAIEYLGITEPFRLPRSGRSWNI